MSLTFELNDLSPPPPKELNQACSSQIKTNLILIQTEEIVITDLRRQWNLLLPTSAPHYYT